MTGAIDFSLDEQQGIKETIDVATVYHHGVQGQVPAICFLLFNHFLAQEWSSKLFCFEETHNSWFLHEVSHFEVLLRLTWKGGSHSCAKLKGIEAPEVGEMCSSAGSNRCADERNNYTT